MTVLVLAIAACLGLAFAAQHATQAQDPKPDPLPPLEGWTT